VIDPRPYHYYSTALLHTSSELALRSSCTKRQPARADPDAQVDSREEFDSRQGGLCPAPRTCEPRGGVVANFEAQSRISYLRYLPRSPVVQVDPLLTVGQLAQAAPVRFTSLVSQTPCTYISTATNTLPSLQRLRGKASKERQSYCRVGLAVRRTVSAPCALSISSTPDRRPPHPPRAGHNLEPRSRSLTPGSMAECWLEGGGNFEALLIDDGMNGGADRPGPKSTLLCWAQGTRHSAMILARPIYRGLRVAQSRPECAKTMSIVTGRRRSNFPGMVCPAAYRAPRIPALRTWSHPGRETRRS